MAGFWRRKASERPPEDSVEAVRRRIEGLRELVEKNNQVLELIAKAGEMLGGEYVFDRNSLAALAEALESATRGVVFNLNVLTRDRYPELVEALKRVDASVRATLESRVFVPEADAVIPLAGVGEEIAELVGEKIARLGSLRKLGTCGIPEGFAITAYACRLFFEQAGVEEAIERWRRGSDAERTAGIVALSAEIRERLRTAKMPKRVARAIRDALGDLEPGVAGFAVRSSAIGEDGELSFAGQYTTRLGVARADVLQAYRDVVSSLFAPGVMRYRASGGLDPARGLMAVGCLRMVAARASGVVYTFDPNDPSRRVLQVAAARGFGRAVVEGTVPVDRFEVSREAPHAVVSRHVAEKTEMDVVGPGGGMERTPVPSAERSHPALSDGELETLAVAALQIETYMKSPQDVEWAVDAEGRLFILQARPLRVATAPAARRGTAEVASRHAVLMRGKGVVAFRGIGAGPVRILRSLEDEDAIAPGAVLVARVSSPRLAAAVAQAAALVTDIGTPTGHLAAIAREFRVPAIVDAGVATQTLAEGTEVTVDAEENVVYAGRVGELLEDQLLRSETFADAPEFRLLRRMLKKIAPLNLKDPRSATFFPQYCRSYHDIIRFAHEKAMEEVAEGHRLTPRPGARNVRRLNLNVPLDLLVIDLGGGVERGAEDASLGPERIASHPLRAVIEGLTTEGVWAQGPADMDLDGFMSSMARSQALTDQLALRPELNVAIASADYLNLSLRLGYHFNVVDAFLSASRSDNYIYFRFAGGVTEIARRARRAVLLRQILAANDFVTGGTGDLVVGRFNRMPYEATVERLRMVGRLIGFTRQLDILLRDDRLVERLVKSFMEGKYANVAG